MKLRLTKFALIFFMLLNLCDASYSNVPEKATFSNNRYGRSKNTIEKSKPHKYLTMLLSSIESNPDLNPLNRNINDGMDSPNARDRGKRKRLFFTWMPTEIKETSPHKTTIMFQSSPELNTFLGDFTGSKIVLTLRDDFQQQNDIQITMHLSLANNNLTMNQNDLSQTQTQFILSDNKFITFDIYKFLAVCHQNDSSHHSMIINIVFEVKSTQKIDFKNVFDVQDDKPFIMIFYHGFLPKEIASSGHKQSSRKTRAVHGRPSSQCQRREFFAYAHEVYWLNLISPLKLDLGYCSGTCPSPLQDQYYNMTLHSFLLDRYRMMAMFDAPRDFPHSTCIPVTYKSLTVLEQIGPGEFEASVERDISVATCGCRY
ncbi:unnamed protein product [Orchesella dallaii]|uniref:TGF-beta family profile domain-containing protein n=1 Tax=Orchesella dallaii TaxID=48710 RepID=A0ABP1RU88_9HEXA